MERKLSLVGRVLAGLAVAGGVAAGVAGLGSISGCAGSVKYRKMPVYPVLDGYKLSSVEKENNATGWIPKGNEVLSRYTVKYDGGKPGEDDDLGVEVTVFESGKGLKTEIEKLKNNSIESARKTKQLSVKEKRINGRDVCLFEFNDGSTFAIWQNQNTANIAQTSGSLEEGVLEQLTK